MKKKLQEFLAFICEYAWEICFVVGIFSIVLLFTLGFVLNSGVCLGIGLAAVVIVLVLCATFY